MPKGTPPRLVPPQRKFRRETKGTHTVPKFEIYKKGQGKYTRILTFLGVMVVGLIGAVILSDNLAPLVGTYLRYGIPVVALAALGALMFWLVNRPKSADFLIATEGEMKKVSWSSRKEIVGSTKVVIVTTFIMAVILFGVDIVFKVLGTVIGLWPKGF
ncbi:MAG TPA: preprotein translocase subunit SecE [Phycisphaerales bacterium]|nr:preprotein translocase subunit SecE [Phycisphaerales bacterium]